VLNGPGPTPVAAANVTEADLQYGFASLVLAHQRLLTLVVPGMRARGWGRVIAIGSSGVVAPLPDLVVSNAGRAALAAYLKTLSTEVAADGVTVNVVLPGRINTDRVVRIDEARAKRAGTTLDEVAAEARAGIPEQRYGDPEEFAAVVAFLAGNPASYVTGTTIRCDGGLVPTL
jgi:3-oxoacyl-[acyl-carrier protein] reductase